MQRYPAKFGDPNDWTGGFPNMIVVAASDWQAERASFSHYSPWVTTFAPRANVRCPAVKSFDDIEPTRPCSGTSYGT
jgi:hypothetical protein